MERQGDCLKKGSPRFSREFFGGGKPHPAKNEVGRCIISEVCIERGNYPIFSQGEGSQSLPIEGAGTVGGGRSTTTLATRL